jgi:hypothetical protein
VLSLQECQTKKAHGKTACNFPNATPYILKGNNHHVNTWRSPHSINNTNIPEKPVLKLIHKNKPSHGLMVSHKGLNMKKTTLFQTIHTPNTSSKQSCYTKEIHLTTS